MDELIIENLSYMIEYIFETKLTRVTWVIVIRNIGVDIQKSKRSFSIWEIGAKNKQWMVRICQLEETNHKNSYHDGCELLRQANSISNATGVTTLTTVQNHGRSVPQDKFLVRVKQ